jgi:hypothetical protein
MGQISSSSRSSDHSATSKHFLTLYSHRFPVDEAEEEELYLNNYGGMDDFETEVDIFNHSTPDMTATDDDYPIYSIHANIEVANARNPHDMTESKQAADPSIFPRSANERHLETFDISHEEHRVEFDRKYKSLDISPSLCSRELQAMKKCYRDRDDLLDCAPAVREYSLCANRAVDDRLK